MKVEVKGNKTIFHAGKGKKQQWKIDKEEAEKKAKEERLKNKKQGEK